MYHVKYSLSFIDKTHLAITSTDFKGLSGTQTSDRPGLTLMELR